MPYWVKANIANGWLEDFTKNDGAHLNICELFQSPFMKEDAQWCLSDVEQRELNDNETDPIAMIAIAPSTLAGSPQFDVWYFSDAITNRVKTIAKKISFSAAEEIVRREMAAPKSFCDIFEETPQGRRWI